MPTQVFATYRLRAETDVAQYEEWSRTVDQPICLQAESCLSFEVYVVKGGDADSAPFNVIEDIVVESWEAWQDTLRSDDLAEMMAQWRQLADESTLVTVYCERIQPTESDPQL
ncbi:hypothetical protein ASF40_20655 [Microbacterium sp. Leaf288]|uniref:hypothetical protein n=1 Tax=Microbacterium sp. Leaf288 TaxID=1736323 RepID=UPI0006F7AF00|nr:hypothetical protein [Microbacterium sp. Leaf288]KQP72997.1 hypothetical protein ASF40_20655 [Microbacterium sp. Leaf288]